MYVPTFNEENNVARLHCLIKTKPLGAWSTLADGEIVANHIPFLLHEKRGSFGTLVGHVAKANPIWKNFSTELDSLVVFQGAQAYITPSWYPSKHRHGRAVPTWNYVVVHAHGMPRVIDDPEWLLQHINELTDLHEKEQSLPWKVSDAPLDFIDTLARSIVGVEIPISKLSGKWKLGQNRSVADKLGTSAGLMSTEEPEAQQLANLLSEQVSCTTERR